MKMVAKGILKDHLVPVASSTTCSGNLNGFNNAGYKATFRPLKSASTSYRVHLVYPYEMLEKTAERCHPNSLGCVVSSCSWGKHVVLSTESSFDILY
jgi:DNA-directed RNA polymerase-5 subunit 1